MFFMLALLNNFLYPDLDVVTDKRNNQSYLPIHKCGSTTLLHLTKLYPKIWIKQTTQEFFKTGQKHINVFVRDPVERYISGLLTQTNIYKIPYYVIDDLLYRKEIIPMFDSHTIPQFWFMMRFDLTKQVNFRVLDLKNLNDKIASNVHINQSSAKKLSLSAKILDKINYAMTEDIVLYDQFVGKTATLYDICTQIRHEVNFCNEFKSRAKLLTYLN